MTYYNYMDDMGYSIVQKPPAPTPAPAAQPSQTPTPAPTPAPIRVESQAVFGPSPAPPQNIAGILGSVASRTPAFTQQSPAVWESASYYTPPPPPSSPPPPPPAPQQAQTAAQGGVTNYLFRYPDGTTGNSPFQRDASGNVITNAAGGVTEGAFLGRTMEDGSVNQSPVGNVTADGRVHLYGGYSTDADTYYSDANAAAWGRSNNVGARPTAGYGYAQSEVIENNKQPYRIGAGQSGAGSSGGGAGVGPQPGSSGGSSGGSSPAAQSARSVDAGSETIEGRIKNILATDANGNYTNPLIQQAASSAMQQFAGRGLLNSSMANEAAMQAAMSKAIEIAGPDAQTYFAQGRANQDASNVFERDARGYSQENARLDKQLNFDMEKFDRDLQYRYDALKIDQSSQTEARTLAQKYAVEMENIKAVNSAYDLYLRRISDIDANPDYSAETKIKMKNEAGKDFDIYAKTKSISEDMGLGNRFSTPEPTPNAKPKPEDSGPSGSGMLYEGGA